MDVEITKVGKILKFPLVLARTKNLNQYINDHIHPEFYTDSDDQKAKNIDVKYTKNGNIINTYSKIELEDLVKFQRVEFRVR